MAIVTEEVCSHGELLYVFSSVLRPALFSSLLKQTSKYVHITLSLLGQVKLLTLLQAHIVTTHQLQRIHYTTQRTCTSASASPLTALLTCFPDSTTQCMLDPPSVQPFPAFNTPLSRHSSCSVAERAHTHIKHITSAMHTPHALYSTSDQVSPRDMAPSLSHHAHISRTPLNVRPSATETHADQ
jgi:hypothetical protein